MRVTVLAVGKIKEAYLRDAVKEYSKRLGKYCRLQIIEVADEKTPDLLRGGERELILKKEGERLQRCVSCHIGIDRQAAHIRGVFREDQRPGGPWDQPYGVCHRRVPGAGKGCVGKI